MGSYSLSLGFKGWSQDVETGKVSSNIEGSESTGIGKGEENV
jgi:hypothetical protein